MYVSLRCTCDILTSSDSASTSGHHVLALWVDAPIIWCSDIGTSSSLGRANVLNIWFEPNHCRLNPENLVQGMMASLACYTVCSTDVERMGFTFVDGARNAGCCQT